jgi:hypothetical protein
MRISKLGIRDTTELEKVDGQNSPAADSVCIFVECYEASILSTELAQDILALLKCGFVATRYLALPPIRSEQ